MSLFGQTGHVPLEKRVDELTVRVDKIAQLLDARFDALPAAVAEKLATMLRETSRDLLRAALVAGARKAAVEASKWAWRAGLAYAGYRALEYYSAAAGSVHALGLGK